MQASINTAWSEDVYHDVKLDGSDIQTRLAIMLSSIELKYSSCLYISSFEDA